MGSEMCIRDSVSIGEPVFTTGLVGLVGAVVGVVLRGADVAVVFALENLGHLLAQEHRGAEAGAVLVAVDPGIREVEVGQSAVLAVGDVGAQIPGSAEKIAFLQLHLTENTLALAVAKTAGELAGGLLDDAKHDHHIARLFRHRPQGDLDITEQLGGVEPFDIPLKLITVERIAGLDRNLSGCLLYTSPSPRDS